MFKKSFFTAITVVSLSVSNSLAQSIEIPNIDDKPIASKQVLPLITMIKFQILMLIKIYH